MSAPTILIVSDDTTMVPEARAAVAALGHDADHAPDADMALAMDARRRYALVIVQMTLPARLDLVEALHKADAAKAIITIHSASGTDFGVSLTAELRALVTRALKRRSLDMKLDSLRREVQEHLGRIKRQRT